MREGPSLMQGGYPSCFDPPNLQVVKVLLKSDFFGFLQKNVFTFAP